MASNRLCKCTILFLTLIALLALPKQWRLKLAHYLKYFSYLGLIFISCLGVAYLFSITILIKRRLTSHWKGLMTARVSLSFAGAWVRNAPESANVRNENSTAWRRSHVIVTSPKKKSAFCTKYKSVYNFKSLKSSQF